LEEKKYGLKDLVVSDLLSVTFGNEIIVNVSDKCPDDIRNIVYDHIKKSSK